jgi:hypothetical protein
MVPKGTRCSAPGREVSAPEPHGLTRVERHGSQECGLECPARPQREPSTMEKTDNPPTNQRSDDNLRALVRRNLRDGTLPPAFERTYAARGTDTPCNGCGVTTKASGIEVEGRRLRAES